MLYCPLHYELLRCCTSKIYIGKKAVLFRKEIHSGKESSSSCHAVIRQFWAVGQSRLKGSLFKPFQLHVFFFPVKIILEAVDVIKVLLQ